MWMTRNKCGGLVAFSSKPVKCEAIGCWYGNNIRVYIEPSEFPEVKWEDEEPTELKLSIKSI